MVYIYSQCSISVGSTSADSTNHRLRGKKKTESSIKRNLRWLHSTNFLHDIYIVFTTVYIAFTLY